LKLLNISQFIFSINFIH